MPLLRDDFPKQITDRLFDLADKLKTRTRARLTDANHSLETVMQRFFNALFGWDLVNLNAGQGDFPAADLGDRGRRIAMQITNENAGKKITNTAATAYEHRLGENFGRLIIFFLLQKKPRTPNGFLQPVDGPNIECWDITDLLKQMQQIENPRRLESAAAVLEEEISAGIEAPPLERYFQALSENFSTYENLGLPPPANSDGERDIALPIRSLFVEPACAKSRVSPEEFDAALLRGQNPAEPLLPLLALPEDHTGAARRTVLLADPGMGKSTLIQWIIATLAAKAQLPLAADGLRGAIPLPFILRDLVGHMPKDVARWDWRALLNAFRNYHPRAADRPALAAALTGDEALFASILDSERAFFLIDGLDEIGNPEQRRALRNALWEGFDQHRAARWLVTSRVVGYDEAAVDFVKIERNRTSKFATKDTNDIRKTLLAARIPEEPWMFGDHAHETAMSVERRFAQLLYLAPFDDGQQITFARHWYIPRLGDVAGEERATSFVHAVRQHPSVRVIGRVPNLLYLLALLYRHKAHLPNGRALVYAAISEAYLEGIDLDRHLDGDQTIPYKLSEKVRLLATVARHIQERRSGKENDGEVAEILVTHAELEQWLAPHFPTEGGTVAQRDFIRYVAARSGLLLPRGEGLFGFAHLSFQEYYTACWLEEEFRRLLNAQARGNAGGFLRRDAEPRPAGSMTREDFALLAAKPVWREPLVFLVEKISANGDDTLTLVEWLFPKLANEPVVEDGRLEFMPIAAAQLLGALSLDPQVAFAPDQRKSIWAILWRVHMLYSEYGFELASTLLAGSEFQAQVWDALVLIQPKRVSLSRAKAITDIKPLAALTELLEVKLMDCTGITDLAPLAGLAKLEKLYLNRCTGVADISPLASLNQLCQLILVGCSGIADFTQVADFPRLQWLALNETRVADLTPLAGLAQLRTLILDGCTDIVDIAPLAGLAQLEMLDLSDCTGVLELKPLAGLGKLQTLSFFRCTGVSDLTPLGGLAQLETLDLTACTGVSDLAPLAGLAQLEMLDLSDCTGVSDLAPLAVLGNLQNLVLRGCTGVSNLAPLAGLGKLQDLDLIGCTGVSDLAPLAGLGSCRISTSVAARA